MFRTCCAMLMENAECLLTNNAINKPINKCDCVTRTMRVRSNIFVDKLEEAQQIESNLKFVREQLDSNQKLDKMLNKKLYEKLNQKSNWKPNQKFDSLDAFKLL